MKKDKLHNIKSTGFKTPERYFENFEDKLFEKISEEDSISSIKYTGFKVPKDYFDTVEENVLKHIKEKEAPVVKLYTRRQFYYMTGIAAALLLLVTLIINSKQEVNEISAEMVETYLENQDLDSYELAELLTDANILEEDFTITETNFNEDNIESYLLDNADLETFLE